MLFKCFVALSITFSSIFSPAIIAPPSENLDFDVLKYPAEAVKTLEEWGVTVENVNFRSFNSARNSRLMFETDEYANVTFK